MKVSEDKSLFDLINDAKKTLHDNNIISSNLESVILFSHFLNLSREDILLKSKEIYPKQSNIDNINLAIARRLSGEPISHIIGHREFYSLEFDIDCNVLDPRPDSEILIEEAIKLSGNFNNPINILELGVGSGCLILTLLNNIQNSIGTAIDINPKSLIIAKNNAKKLNLEEKIKFIQSNWFDNISNQKFDIIISNPPYIKTGDINNLQTEVKDFEPIIALDGGDDGLDCYREIAKNINKFLHEESILILEIGQNQEDDIVNIFKDNDLKLIKYAKDLNSIIRCLIFAKK